VPKRGRVENLRRGALPGTGATRKASAVLAAQRKDDDRVAELARLDPDQELVESYAELSKALRPLVRELSRQKKAPDRNLIDAIRELRQQRGDIRDLLKARGDAASTSQIFTDLEARLAQANLGDGPTPVMEHPSRSG
jgi:hypothetical protein